MKIAVVIPSYNEGQKLQSVLENLQSSNYDIIVVDDGSNDNTSQLLEKHSIYHTKHNANLGQGAALKTGTNIARKMGVDIVIHFDADGQHRLEDLKKIIKQFELNTELEVVLGSRFLDNKTQFTKLKKVILRIAKIFTKSFLQLEFSDPQSGLRGIKISALDKLDWQSDDFRHCTEILNLIKINKLNFQEIPIIVNYDKYSQTKKSIMPQIMMGWKLLITKFFN